MRFGRSWTRLLWYWHTYAQLCIAGRIYSIVIELEMAVSNPVNTVTSRRRQADVMYIGNASSSSSWRLADVPQMSVTDPAVELTICATDRELRRHFGEPRAAGWREGVMFPATRTDEAAPAWQAPARLTIARRACTASRQILDDWRNRGRKRK